jgi:two-component system, NarL family, nitrate/nitrite response regulator NarL
MVWCVGAIWPYAVGGPGSCDSSRAATRECPDTTGTLAVHARGARRSVSASERAGVRVGRRLRVSVAHRHTRVLQVICSVVSREFSHELVGQTSTGVQALEQIRGLRPQIAILDMELPKPDGIAILSAIETERIGTRVVLLSGETDPRRLFEALVMGARCVLAPDTHEQELLVAIEAAADDATVISTRLHPVLFSEIRRRGGSDEPPLDQLNKEILTLTAEGLSPGEIAERMYLSPATVKARLHRLYQRLGVGARAAAVAEALRRGLID